MFVFVRARSRTLRTGSRAGARRGCRTPCQRARLTPDLVVRFPNVSVIDLHEILAAVRKVFGVVTISSDVVGSLVVS